MELLKNWKNKRGLFGIVFDIVITYLLLTNAYSYVVKGVSIPFMALVLTEFIILALWFMLKLDDMGIIEFSCKVKKMKS